MQRPPLCLMAYFNYFTCSFVFSPPGLYNFLPPDSREFEDLVKTVSSCYLDSSSRGTFTYCKARLIRNELLEKEVGCRELFVFVFVFFVSGMLFIAASHLGVESLYLSVH